jgi:hypothetical protein
MTVLLCPFRGCRDPLGARPAGGVLPPPAATLDQVEAGEQSAALDINFDPLVLPAGVAPSDDPLLSARSAVYSQSFTRRAGETKQPSAITPADVRKGE